MKKTRLSMAAACLSALLATSAAHAEQLLTLTFAGSATGVPRIDAINPTIDSTMAPFASPHAFTAKVTIDMDTPLSPAYTQLNGLPMFPGSIKSYEFAIPDLNVLAYATGAKQDVELYEQHVIIKGTDNAAMLATTGPAVFTGYLHFANYYLPYAGASADLHNLARLPDLLPSKLMEGTAYVAAPGCGPGNMCGFLSLNLQSLTVTAVPEPGTLGSMATGLAGVAMVLCARRRRAPR